MRSRADGTHRTRPVWHANSVRELALCGMAAAGLVCAQFRFVVVCLPMQCGLEHLFGELVIGVHTAVVGPELLGEELPDRFNHKDILE